MNRGHTNPGYDFGVDESPVSDAKESTGAFRKPVARNHRREKNISEPRCGWGPFVPDCLQVMHNPVCLLVTLCFMIGLQGSIVNGLFGTSVTTIEKRFDMTSTHIGIINAIYEVTIVILLIPVSYYGDKGHKGRMLGIGTLLLGVGSIIFAIPQFVSGHYLDGAVTNESEDLLCQPGSNISDPCTGYTDQATSKMFWVFLAAMIVIGSGVSTMYTLAFVYLDENVSHRNSSFFTGFYYGVAVLGGAIGYLIGGATLGIYGDILSVDPKSLNLTPSNWYGAWWIGYIACGIAAILLSFPLFGFAKELPNAKTAQEERSAEATISDNVNVAGGFGSNLKDLPKSLKRLFRNPTFILLIVADGLDAFVLSGFIAFTPKIFEVQFGANAIKAALYTGVSVIPSGFTGAAISGLIIRKLNLQTKQLIRFGAAMFAVSFCFLFGLLAHCDRPTVLGLPTAEYSISSMGAENVENCNKHCGCNANMYRPLCHQEESVLYYSPCHAGCQGQQNETYLDCQCLMTNGIASVQDNDTTLLPPGSCSPPCAMGILFIVILFLGVFFTFMAATPNIQGVLRCVRFSDRSLASGVSWVFIRIIGAIPGPIVYGVVIDKSCELWTPDCGDGFHCRLYNQSDMRRNVLLLSLCFRGMATVLMFLASVVYKPPKPQSDASSSGPETQNGAYNTKL